MTGTWLAVRANWGLTKHYWVIAKWIGNIGAVVFGSNFMRIWVHENFTIIFSSSIHPLQNPVYLNNRQMLFIGLAITLLMFLFTVSYFKPWGKRKSISQGTAS